jgi:uncharacterized membrane protein (UPF0182 family)
VFEDTNDNSSSSERTYQWPIKVSPLTIIVVAVFAVIFLARAGIALRLDWIWFKVLEYDAVWWRMLLSRFIIGGIVFVPAFILSFLNIYLIHRLAKRPFRLLMSLILAAAVSMPAALTAGASWMTVLQFLNSLPFGLTDPQYNLDIGFYIFNMPFYWLVYRVVSTWLIINLIVTAAHYVIYFPRGIEIITEGLRSTRIFSGAERRGLTHIGVFLGLSIAWQAVQYKLSAYELLSSQTGSVIGAGAADIGAKLPVYSIMMVISAILGVLIIFLFKKRLKPAVFALVGYFLVAAVLTGFLPGLYQKFIIDPEELVRETPYLERNIKYTRLAYNLDNLTEVEYPVGELTAQDLAANQDIIDNIRILDLSAAQRSYGQQQEIRLYYDFSDVDVDRYMIDGKLTQVFLSARELNQASLPTQAQNFNNLMFIYTHGFGLVMSPANAVDSQGLPSYLIQDIPPVSKHFEVKEPRIYFGEVTDTNVIVNTKLKEFDYPLGNNNAEYLYQGKLGIPMTFLNKVSLALRDVQIKYLLTNYITPESQYLESRRILDRAYRIAPFLQYDGDPYLVLGEDGKLYYILDAYTVSNQYPYSVAVDETQRVNYIRNSVKIVVDAYSGEINFYIADGEDPIIRVYQKIFPGLFQEFEVMPEDLKQHVRYPEYIFDVQSLILRDYHMGNTTVFYNREDRWEFALETYNGVRRPQESYYSIIRLPGEDEPEFIQMRAYTPTGKQNQIAWLAARSDAENYGKLLLYLFPKGIQVPGTMQVESIIDQDPNISSQLTLWSQGGSEIIRGNLLIYPLGGSLLYVEPLYIESEQNKFPQLRKIFVFYNDRVVMENTLQDALITLFGAAAPQIGEEEQPSAPDDGTAPSLRPDAALQDLIRELVSLHNEAQTKLRAGDLESYGRLQKQIDGIIEALE